MERANGSEEHQDSMRLGVRDDGEPSDSDARFFEDDDRSCLEISGKSVQVAEKKRRLGLGPPRTVSAKEDQRRPPPVGVGEQTAEIGIRRDEDPPFGRRSLEDGQVVGAAQSELRSVDDVMASVNEYRNEECREVLVEEKPHEVGVRGSARSRTASAA
jgi:hypothetical protein